MENDKAAQLVGTVEETVFRREDTGFSVVNISDSEGMLVCAVGIMPELSPGEGVSFEGNWDFHKSFGRQFRVLSCKRSLPSSAALMLKYLSSGALKGIGPATAARIVEKFGDRSFEIIEHEPRELAKIRGISESSAERLSKNFAAQAAARNVMISLEAMGLTQSECLLTYGYFGVLSVGKVEENPYSLCDSEIGISFERADALAKRLPVTPDSRCRTEAGIIHVLSHNLLNGHSCVPREKLLSPCSSLLGISKEEVDDAISSLSESSKLVCRLLDDREFVFLPELFEAEYKAAHRLKLMLAFPPSGRSLSEEEYESLGKSPGLSYEKLQRKAIVTAAEKGLLILTGGPGTGKTTTLNGILSLFEKEGLRVVLTAPTGRAAQRMSEITGREAFTVHRLLEAERDGGEKIHFCRNGENPIEADALIADELSMMDISLFSALLEALPLGCRLIMVGDEAQLPPVGPGNVLRDLLDSELLPVVRLNKVFRQALCSLIVSNAHRIVRGESPELSRRDGDFFHLERQTAAETAETVKELYKKRLPSAYGYVSARDIQVLCPSKKGEAGTVNLNRILQQAVNPPSPEKKELKFSTRVFREGDKVMQTKNNYNIEWRRGAERGDGIFNGDVGIIRKIDSRGGRLSIDFDGRLADFPAEALSELELAYAVTVHKSQGSEFQAVILPISDMPPQLMYRNLLYTAVTRARSQLITVGRASKISAMAANDRKLRRYSALKYFLRGC